MNKYVKPNSKKGYQRSNKTSFRPKKRSIQMVTKPTKILKFLYSNIDLKKCDNNLLCDIYIYYFYFILFFIFFVISSDS